MENPFYANILIVAAIDKVDENETDITSLWLQWRRGFVIVVFPYSIIEVKLVYQGVNVRKSPAHSLLPVVHVL